MDDLTRKAILLEDAGYRYTFDRGLYVNREEKKAFSVEFVEDRTAEEIAAGIREKTPGTEWRFFFTEGPSDGVKRELVRVLG